MLAEQIGFAFLAEVGFDDPRPAAADAAGISERDIMRVAAGILIDCDQARHAAAADLSAAHGMARTLGGDHDDIDVGGRFAPPEMDIEAVPEGDSRAGEVIALGDTFPIRGPVT